jgi:hypothetical protein
MYPTDNTELNSNKILNNALKGAIAGAIGVWAMDRLDWFLYRREDPQATRRIKEVRPGGMDPAHVATNRAANLLDTQLHPTQPHPAGVGIHYALGVGPAAVYGAMRERLPVSTHGQDYLYGLGLGLGLFLVQDEGLNQVMGLSGKQKDYPWQSHARGLVAHLTLGFVTNLVLNLLNAPRPVPHQAANLSGQPEQQDNDFVPMASYAKTEESRASLH